MKSDFFNLLYRTHYIKRWSGTFCIESEDVAQHSYNVILITHLLCKILKHEYSKTINIEKVLVAALYHDATDTILTHIISPVKNDNLKTKSAIKELKNKADKHIYSMLPESWRSDSLDNMTEEIVEIADVIDAYCKSSTEIKRGNFEFQSAHEDLSKKLMAYVGSKLYVKTFYDMFLLDFSKKDLSYRYLK